VAGAQAPFAGSNADLIGGLDDAARGRAELPGEAPADDPPVVVASAGPDEPVREAVSDAPPEAPRDASADDRAAMIHRDNTFGTPEEDAFRRDFTINGLFYDIATFSLIDYVGGLDDLERRIIRSIGDPNLRFVEDPVRMFRAAVFAARLGFEMDDLVLEAIARHRALILKASPARLLEEYFKILRSGYAEASFRALKQVRLLELVTPELKSPSAAVWESLARLDRYRRRFPSAPAELTNTILAGALLMPLGALERRAAAAQSAGNPRHVERVSFGMLQVAKKDLERLRHMNMLLPRLADPSLPPRVVRSLPHRPAFPDAMSWLEIYGDSPEMLEHWKQAHQARSEEMAEAHPPDGPAGAGPAGRPRRRRRRRRGRGRGGSGNRGGGEGPAAA
jgi:poly(A) polymerase